ncbi:unnamed protein product [Gongylonema pulchrum]|uniref:Ion_trans_2 domain-containing protein n=1 Tax=Gongylonema pulchrum TaxID=637853 RepID=A0A183E8X1_9BILA|nr:unnamed protein product [Gongylonema pulchrum]
MAAQGNWQKICADADEEPSDSINTEDKKVATWSEALTLFVAFFIYIIIGSIVIASYEPEMDFFGAIYFNFVSLTTIGLGDLVPKNETYLALTLVYSAVGLALTTIAIEIASDYLKMLHYFGRKLDNVANVQIWFGGKMLTVKQLVRNLGDHFNLPVEQIAELDLDEFVDAAIKVEAGELATLRVREHIHFTSIVIAEQADSQHAAAAFQAPCPIGIDIDSLIFMDADDPNVPQSYAPNPPLSSRN